MLSSLRSLAWGFYAGFHFPALEGDVDRVNRLLQKGVFVDAVDSAGYTALHYATRRGHVRVCELLLEHGAKVDARTRSMGATPLHRAACMGNVEVVDLLLRHGAAPNLTDADGRTALHRVIPMAGSVGGAETARRLLSITDRGIRDNHGETVDDAFERWKTTESDSEKVEAVKRLFYA
ncbi:ankyrin repeat domain-containing protein 39 isoform X2 [Monomorium pharaonis]|uniref:ankyrin repeat domain-containing protein 39 isoform X2 n=1 Tax=Monomorium pharaonis TaxID=307658 RepID=UPI00063F2B42|nr:ankyrin repeat domain-containing protein 39 isoform X2 [Monomorium pharaonis]XP_028046451.1 ankyrin repeat domain-containing protein 39 isoform X2 [Monomorium pharaonis]